MALLQTSPNIDVCVMERDQREKGVPAGAILWGGHNYTNAAHLLQAPASTNNAGFAPLYKAVRYQHGAQSKLGLPAYHPANVDLFRTVNANARNELLVVGSLAIGQDYLTLVNHLEQTAISLAKNDEQSSPSDADGLASIREVRTARPPQALSWIDQSISGADLDEGAAEAAAHARADVACLLSQQLSWTHPITKVGDDGSITLHWRSGAKGVMLVFIGDGTVACAIKQPSMTYGSSVRNVMVASPLPPEVRDAIISLDAPPMVLAGIVRLAPR